MISAVCGGCQQALLGGRVCDVCRPAFRRADMWSGESDASHLRTQSLSFFNFFCASGSCLRAYVWYCSGAVNMRHLQEDIIYSSSPG